MVVIDDDDKDDGVVVVDRWLVLILASFDSFRGNADTNWYGCDLNVDDGSDVVIVAVAIAVEVVGIVDFDIDGW